MERIGGNLKAARRLLLLALSVEPENSAVLMEAALVEEGMGNGQIAAEYFQLAAIGDKQRSRLKRKLFESRKSASHFELLKLKTSALQNGDDSGVAKFKVRHKSSRPKKDVWRAKPSSFE
jgi:hypothetical protein